MKNLLSAGPKVKKSFRNIQNTKVFPEDFDLEKHSAGRLTEYLLPFLQILRQDIQIIESRGRVHIER
jgi:hypothetical protein